MTDARIQQDRALLARMAREAAEKRQLLVLIIIDTPDPNTSILNMQSYVAPSAPGQPVSVCCAVVHLSHFSIFF